MLFWSVLAMFIGPLGLLFLCLNGPKRVYDADTGIFKLKSFTMDTKTGRFTVNGRCYHRSAVREVHSERFHKMTGSEVGGKNTIVVNDLQHPVHHLIFRTIFRRL